MPGQTKWLSQESNIYLELVVYVQVCSLDLSLEPDFEQGGLAIHLHLPSRGGDV